MDLYLVQHGEAVPESADPERPLSPRGRTDVERVARAAGRAGLSVSVVHHSGKLRARQTAEILASFLVPPPEVRATAGLGPNDDPAAAARLAGQEGAPIMIVGHLPQLARLASLLLVGDPDREIVAFRMGAVVCLSRDAGLWRLRFLLTPEISGA